MQRACVGVALGLVLVSMPFPGCTCEPLSPLNHIIGPGSISGRICDPGEGKGIYGADVYVVVKGEKVATTSDGNGDFNLAGVAPGTYTVYVDKGSFSTTLDDVVVSEGKPTELPTDECIKPKAAQMFVVSGHDSVENVLQRIGYDNFTLVNSHDDDHTAATSSWFLQAFSDLPTMQQNDVIFINCGPHEWALDDFDQTQVNAALQNLRDYVEQGGELYVSDWAYDILERLYPDSATWYGDDTVEDDAQVAIAQSFTGAIVDADLSAALAKDSVDLLFNQGQVGVATSLGPNATPLITADIDVKTSSHDTEHLTDVPVLFEVKPDATAQGHVLYTSFHNGPNNTPDMDDVLRAIIFTL